MNGGGDVTERAPASDTTEDDAETQNPALGAPTQMLAVREELTPMMAQYTDLCEAYDASLVLFQVGDFYEAFCHAAEEVARICEVTLTKREDSTGEYPMAGVPIDNAASYVERLLDAGYRVALADQVQPAEEASGLVDRAVTRLVTPGTLVDDALLDGSRANYLGAVVQENDEYGFAAVDVSTGECLVTSGDRTTVTDEIARLGPRELLTGPNVDAEAVSAQHAMHTAFDERVFTLDAARETLTRYVEPDAVLDADVEMRATGAALAYAEYTQGDERLDYVSRVRRLDPRETMRLDATALASLELFESRSQSGRTLMGTLDDTASAIGRRRLESWLRRPTVDEEEAESRLDAVSALVESSLAREEMRDLLSNVYDLERLVGRISRGRANARDLRSLATTLDVVPEVKDEVASVAADEDGNRLAEIAARLDDCGDVRSLIHEAIVTDPPQEITEGGVIREGFDAELDELRETEREGREWVSQLEARERERTGIDSLDVGYTQVHGYYIEVTNPNLNRVPDDYTRRQTLKNSERYYTPELKRREDEILSASERADALEYEVFCEVRETVAEAGERIQRLADALAELDVLTTFAAQAVRRDYTRPTFGSEAIRIERGRHPVVEQTTEFVPNGIDFSHGTIALITGPNMSGKSTYMRQIALICLMAQAGSFVPAETASLRLVDRLFTRVGASDDIAGGQSTFMREMAELTDILHAATEESLVLLDEVGRGTATTDGVAIAQATTEFIHDEVGATTLFATHYHELTALEATHEGVFTRHFTAERTDDGVTFLHRVVDGPSSSSYGIEVARLAGVPDPVVARASDLVDAAGAESKDGGEATRGRTNGEANSSSAPEEHGLSGSDGAGESSLSASPQRSGGHAKSAPLPDPSGASRDDQNHVVREVLADIDELDVARTTPMDALAFLHQLQQRLDDANQET